jgi:hypothetical protein
VVRAAVPRRPVRPNFGPASGDQGAAGGRRDSGDSGGADVSTSADTSAVGHAQAGGGPGGIAPGGPGGPGGIAPGGPGGPGDIAPGGTWGADVVSPVGAIASGSSTLRTSAFRTVPFGGGCADDRSTAGLGGRKSVTGRCLDGASGSRGGMVRVPLPRSLAGVRTPIGPGGTDGPRAAGLP